MKPGIFFYGFANYEFLANPKAQFNQLTQPHRENTAQVAQTMPIVLAVGDTTFLDYKNIKAKREGYGPMVKRLASFMYLTGKGILPRSLILCVTWNELES